MTSPYGPGRRDSIPRRCRQVSSPARRQAQSARDRAQALAPLASIACSVHNVFGRRSSEQSATAVGADSTAKAEGRGRPTPTRKEAEEARKRRLTSSRARKGTGGVRRRRATEQRAKVRRAMET